MIKSIMNTSALIEERLLEFSFDVADRHAFTFRGLMATEQLELFLGLVADILHAPKFNSYVLQDQGMRAAMGRMSDGVGIQYGLRGLTYFDDAENEPMPEMLIPLDWRAVRIEMEQAVREVTV